MYNKIASEIKQDSYKKYANDGQRFVIWYLRNIYQLSTAEADECLTDGANDKQIDAVYIDDSEGKIHIIQGKFNANEIITAGPLREIFTCCRSLKDLSVLQIDANNKLKIKIQDIGDAIEDGYDVVFELVSPGKLTEAAKSDLAKFQNDIAEDSSLQAELRIVDKEQMQDLYDEMLQKERPYINHTFTLDDDKWIEFNLAGTRAIIAALPLKECIKIEGIRNGLLFRKNVRQSLGIQNKINKGIASTLRKNIKNFFFFHNGITAICSKYDIQDGKLSVCNLNVVNGCQSLNTIVACSESVRNADDGYIMFRFYEISDAEKADEISEFTNSQSAVKARDLRSNDKNVLALKRAYEERYQDGYFITKRGEQADGQCNKKHVVSLDLLGKQLIAWHSQRPTISYSETKIFDKYFDIFKKDYEPENIQALKELYDAVADVWVEDNPLGFEETLLAMKAYARYHHLYAISVIMAEVNRTMHSTHSSVPSPQRVLEVLKEHNMLNKIVEDAGKCLNIAFTNASDESNEKIGKIFSPQNWTKNKGSIKGIQDVVKSMLAWVISEEEKKKLMLSKEDFTERWSAD